MIKDNIEKIKLELDEIKYPSGRRPLLIAVSKNVGISSIKEAYNSGLRNFAESKPQELHEKTKLLNLDGLKWHFIGHLQTNKVKYVVPVAEFIHSVDSFDLLNSIDSYASRINKIQNCFLEFKTSSESTKSGFESEESLIRALELAQDMHNIKIKGIMTISPFVDDTSIIRESFIKLRKLKERICLSHPQVQELSMGMTGDFKIAIDEGSTMIRIGTAIFGERDYSIHWRETLMQ